LIGQQRKFHQKYAFIYLYKLTDWSPTQIKSLGYTFDENAFAKENENTIKICHKTKSAGQKFRRLADTQKKTIIGTHRTPSDAPGLFVICLEKQLSPTGSNITTERVRFDFNFDRNSRIEEVGQFGKSCNKKNRREFTGHF